MNSQKRLTSLWAPPIVWMVLIFLFSSRPRFGITHTFSVDFIIFKSLHIAAYALLYLLLFRAFAKTFSNTKQALLYSFATTVAYAVSDELHQTYVPTREGKISDVLFDTSGALIALSLVKYNVQIWRK